MYLTAAQLMERFDEVELAQVAPPQSMARVEPPLLRAVILEQDTSAWTQDEIDAAEAGVARIQDAISDAGQEVDGYIGQRHSLPLDPAPDLLLRLVAQIARFYLHDDGATDEIRKRYEDAVRMLKAIAKGEMGLGPSDPSPTSGAGPVATKTRSDRKFTDETLADFR